MLQHLKQYKKDDSRNAALGKQTLWSLCMNPELEI